MFIFILKELNIDDLAGEKPSNDLNEEEIDIDEIREQLNQQQSADENYLNKKVKLLSRRSDQTSFTSRVIPLAPAPPPPPSSATNNTSLSNEEKEEYEKQGAIPKNRPKTSELNHYSTNLGSNTNVFILNEKNSDNLSGSLNVPPHHLRYFSCDLALTDEERLKLVNDDYNELIASQRSNVPKSATHLDDSPMQKLRKQLSQPSNASGWNSPSLTSRYLTTSATQAASAAVRLLRRDFFDRLTTRGASRGVYRIEAESQRAELPGTSQMNEANFNEYESFNPSLDDEFNSNYSTDNETKSFFKNENDEDDDDDDEEEDYECLIGKNLNDDYYEEIDENYCDRKPESTSRRNRRHSIEAANSKSKATHLKRPHTSNKSKDNANRQNKSCQKKNCTRFNVEDEVTDLLAKTSDISRKILTNNDSLNNLDFRIDECDSLKYSTANLNTKKKKHENFENLIASQMGNGGEEQDTKGLKSKNLPPTNRTYEEIMQISNADFNELGSGKSKEHTRLDQNNGHYRMVNNCVAQPKFRRHNAIRRNRSTGSSGKRYVPPVGKLLTTSLTAADATSLVGNENEASSNHMPLGNYN